MAATAVRVDGLREFQGALKKINKEAAETVNDAFKTAVQPVVRTAQAKKSRYAGVNIGLIGPRVSVRGVFVTDRSRKVTGLRRDFGVLIQGGVLEAALEEHQDGIVGEVGDAIDSLGVAAGF